MSPLDLLEEKSRKLAIKDDHDGAGSRGQQNYDHLQVQGSNAGNRSSYNSVISNASTIRPVVEDTSILPQNVVISREMPPLRRQLIDDGNEWSPRSRGSMSSINTGISSISGRSGGGILDSFRLSSLPGYDPDAASLYSVESSVSSVRNIQPMDSLRPGESSRPQSLTPDRHAYHGNAGRRPRSPLPDSGHQRNTSVDSTSTLRPEDHQVYRPKASNHRNSPSNASTSSFYSALSNPVASSSPSKHREQFIPPASSPKTSATQRRSQYYFNDSQRPGMGSKGQSSYNAHLMTPPPLKTHASSSDIPQSDKKFSEMSLEDHVATGISYHESGNLRESSYHWQYAATRGDPTAQLLYGLALRHGWGVRKNAEEAVKWLRKAMEGSIGEELGRQSNKVQEVASTPAGSDHRSTITAISGDDSKIKRAHVGLALYELGMSYLHSWGIEKDEAMALKSFEMAGDLGDTDALCEAASMYMHSGKGRKKDLHKAAKLYRRAGELGADLVGQSWIYKDKYLDDDEKQKNKKKKNSSSSK